MSKTKPAPAKAAHKPMSMGGLMALLLIIAVLGIVLSFVASRQLVNGILFNNKVISAKNAVNATLKQNLDNVPALQDNYADLKQDGPLPEDVLRALPLNENYAQFSATVEALSSKAGVQLVAVSVEGATTLGTEAPSGPVVGNQPQQVNYRISATGPYAQLVSMVENLQLNVRPVRIQNAVFSGNDPEVLAELLVTTYYQGVTEIGNEVEVISQ